MFRRGGKFLVVTLLVLTTGLHWAALQTVAWSAMLAGNLRGASVSTAVEHTFDGRHPCCLCKAIAAAKQSQKQAEAAAPLIKFEYPPVHSGLVLYPPTRFFLLPVGEFPAGSRSSEPPVPPPRGSVV